MGLAPQEVRIFFVSFSTWQRRLNFNREIWQKGYNEHRIKDPADFAEHVEYVWMNPVKARMVERPEEFLYSSARLKNEIDSAPAHLQIKFQAKARG